MARSLCYQPARYSYVYLNLGRHNVVIIVVDISCLQLIMRLFICSSSFVTFLLPDAVGLIPTDLTSLFVLNNVTTLLTYSTSLLSSSLFFFDFYVHYLIYPYRFVLPLCLSLL